VSLPEVLIIPPLRTYFIGKYYFMESQDKLYQHIKTGEIKPLPLNVYRVVKRNWRPVPESKSKLLEIKTTAPINFAPEVTETQDHDISAEASEPAEGEQTKESLQQEYEQLTGEKPDGRWSVKKLAEKIEETKGSK